MCNLINYSAVIVRMHEMDGSPDGWAQRPSNDCHIVRLKSLFHCTLR